MGGSSGSGAFSNSRSPEELRNAVRKAEDRTSVAAFETELAGVLGNLLGGYNSRDVETMRERLETVKGALQGAMVGSFDIDSLVLINDSALDGKSPQQVLVRMEKIIARQLGGEAKITHGRMALTIEYNDGMIIQLLPALKSKDGHIHVPSSRAAGWSKINPVTFQEALTRRNAECAGKLVPTIKLAKAIVGQLPESQRLSGYHMESLAISAFRNYGGDKITTAMLPTFFERARELVLSPIKDSTGQSIHVDAYLGPANSEARQAASHVLGRIARRMRNATVAGSTAQWRALFGLEQ